MAERPQFGNRFLTSDSDVFQHNAWDNVDWDEEQESLASASVAKNSAVTLTTAEIDRLNNEADKHWDKFYSVHENKFFKDRHWLFTEFPELAPKESDGDAPRSVFEIGCGVGNTILPILKYCPSPTLRVYGGDFAESAIKLLAEHPEMDQERCKVFVLDATAEHWDSIVPFGECSQDIIVLIFVLSAINPSRMQHVINQSFKYLKPGGLLLFRDYGRYDMAQLRFKPGKCLQDNFYVRGDGTLVYFFTQPEVAAMMAEAGYVEEQNLVDRRLQVNRSRMLKMYRVWIQGKFRKPQQ